MYCTHGNKLMRTTTSCHTVAFVFHGYIPEISSISITKIEDWVLLGINEKKISRPDIPVERSDGTTSCLAYVSWKCYLHCELLQCELLQRQETLTTLNKMRRESRSVHKHMDGWVSVTPTSGISWETVPSENKEVIRLDTCETTMQQTEIRWHFPNPQPMESNCSKRFNWTIEEFIEVVAHKTFNIFIFYK